MNDIDPYEDFQPSGYIQFEDELMGFVLPDDVDPDQLGLNWVMP